MLVEEKQDIEDRTETNLVNLRRVIYLTIMNALNYEEAVHKLLKIQIKEGDEVCAVEPCISNPSAERPHRSNLSTCLSNVARKNGRIRRSMASFANVSASSTAFGMSALKRRSQTTIRPSI